LSLPGCRIVLFSGQPSAADALLQAQQNGHDFEILPKPIHPTEVLELIRPGKRQAH
jgi:hypothetical protein